MSSAYQMILDYEAVINCLCFLIAVGSMILTPDQLDASAPTTRLEMITGGLFCLSFSMLALSVFVNILEKGI